MERLLKALAPAAAALPRAPLHPRSMPAGAGGSAVGDSPEATLAALTTEDEALAVTQRELALKEAAAAASFAGTNITAFAYKAAEDAVFAAKMAARPPSPARASRRTPGRVPGGGARRKSVAVSEAAKP